MNARASLLRVTLWVVLVPVVLVLALLVASVVCNQRVRIVDAAGHPLVGAEVEAVTLNVNFASRKTDADGFVDVPTGMGIQSIEWLEITYGGDKGTIDVHDGIPSVVVFAGTDTRPFQVK